MQTPGSDPVAERHVDVGLTYRDGEPVLVSVRRRGSRVDIDDDGRAVTLAGRPPGWLTRAEGLVAADGFNINRRGLVFVPVTAQRDIAGLTARLAACSRRLYLTLLE